MRTFWSGCVLWAVALVALPSTLLADDPPAGEDREALFKKLDANGDGVLTSDEIPEEQQRLFKRMLRTSDKDSDGKLTRDEFMAATKERERPAVSEGGPPAGQQLEALFKSRDANNDGKLVVEEVPEERREGFLMMIERFDADGDKALTLIEFSKGMSAMRGGPGARPEGQRPDGQRPEGQRPDGQRPSGDSPGNRPGGGPDLLFRTLDANGDGTISREESYVAADALRKLDRDGDGSISRNEAGLGAPPPRDGRPGGPPPGAGAQAMIERNDKDNDGKLSKDEAPEFLARGFDRADTNGDGFLDQAELQQSFQAFAANRGGQGPGGGAAPFFKQLDKDGDGKLSKEEAPERMKENFDRVDANGDGFIVIEEFQRVMSMRGQGGEGNRRPGGDAPGRPSAEGGPNPEARLKELDKDGDGKISKDEAPERIRDNFDRIDGNADGFIDLTELRQMLGAGRRPGGEGGPRRPDGDAN